MSRILLYILILILTYGCKKDEPQNTFPADLPDNYFHYPTMQAGNLDGYKLYEPINYDQNIIFKGQHYLFGSPVRHIGMIDPSGNLLWRQIYTIRENINDMEIAEYANQCFALFSNDDGGGSLDHYYLDLYEVNENNGALENRLFSYQVDHFGEIGLLAISDSKFLISYREDYNNAHASFILYNAATNDRISFTYTDDHESLVKKMKLHPNGNIFCLVQFESGSVHNYAIYEIDTTGSLINNIKLNTAKDPQITDLIILPSGDLILTGYEDYNNFSDKRPYVAKLDISNNIQWENFLQDEQHINKVIGITAGNNGQIYLVGEGSKSGVIKIDEQGNYLGSQYLDEKYTLSMSDISGNLSGLWLFGRLILYNDLQFNLAVKMKYF